MKIDINEIRFDTGAVMLVDDRVIIENLRLRNRIVELPEPLHLALQVTNSGDKYLVTGRMKAQVVVECDRCLEKFKLPLDIEFFHEVEKTDLENENIIDLSDSIYEHLLLELPMKTLCDEHCKGLCPQCGQNLNTKDCGCDRQVIDPRLVKLKDFFNNKKD